MSTTPPSWHPDPQYPGTLRYWDGQRWTEGRRPAQVPGQPVAPKNSGCLKWGLIAAGALIVFGIIGVGCLALAGNEVSKKIDKAVGTADKSDYKLTSDSCELTSIGTVEASGTITNTSKKAQGFEVDVRVLQSDGTLIGDGSDFVSKLQKGQRGNWKVVPLETVKEGTGVRCVIKKVSYSIFD